MAKLIVPLQLAEPGPSGLFFFNCNICKDRPHASLYVQIINFIILFFSEKRAKKKKEKKEKRARSVELFSIYRSFAVAISQ